MIAPSGIGLKCMQPNCVNVLLRGTVSSVSCEGYGSCRVSIEVRYLLCFGRGTIGYLRVLIDCTSNSTTPPLSLVLALSQLVMKIAYGTDVPNENHRFMVQAGITVPVY